MPDPISPADAVELIRPTDTLAVPLGPGVPGQFLHALAARDGWTDLEVSGALLPDLYELFLRPGVRLRSGFFGPAERFLLDAGADVQFVPADFRRFAPLLEQIRPRVMATAATEPDADGWMSLSLHAGASVEELRRAAADPERLCVVETSAAFPRTIGLPPEHRHALHVDEVDVVIAGDANPFVLADKEASEVDAAIARIAAAYIPDGATLQTGIGGIPNTVAALLADGPGGGYGIHSEMFTTGLMRLCKAGKVTNDHKGEFDGFAVTTFAAGTDELYEWLDGNDAVRFLPVDVVNSPENISRNREMITINGAMSIDLAGQVIADTIDGRQFSGIGGHEDFIAGAGLELSDRSLICLPSTTEVEGRRVSRIAGVAAAGSIVTTPRHQVDVVITEYGAAELAGQSVRERALALAAIAHPDFRDDLLEQAADWPN
ncbi:MAG: acetyl-CoA hydrolase/transferase C-terminal domain-containing protein [Acidimicrobiales bacterium]|nr:acetyl-CoA hydrolase/transferase C-terminal domain-containing protein [Acidimicrobiales bacterium]